MKIGHKTALGAVLALASIEVTAADLSVVHGINGTDLGLEEALTADLSIDGQCLENLNFGDIDSSLTLDPGTYRAQLHLAGAEVSCEGTLVATTSVDVALNETLTVVAHLSAEGAVTLTKFTDDLRPTSDSANGRLVLHHAGATGALTVEASDGIETLTDPRIITNGDKSTAELAPGLYTVTLIPASVGASGSLPVVSADVLADTNLSVYVVGSQSNNSLRTLTESQPLTPTSENPPPADGDSVSSQDSEQTPASSENAEASAAAQAPPTDVSAPSEDASPPENGREEPATPDATTANSS